MTTVPDRSWYLTPPSLRLIHWPANTSSWNGEPSRLPVVVGAARKERRQRLP